MNKPLSLLLSFSLIAQSLSFAIPAFAQDSPPPTSESSVALEESSSTSTENVPEESSDISADSISTDETAIEGDAAIQTDEATAPTDITEPVESIKNIDIKPKRFSLEDQEVINQNFVNLLSGSAEIRLPLQTPNGIRGLTPSLTLEYSSQAVHQNSSFGYGWNMELGQIKRMNKNGINKMYEDPVFHISIGGFQGELLFIQSLSAADEYRLRKEQGFAKILHYPSENRWELMSTDGMTYRFGSTDDSRFQNDDGSKVAAWYIDRIEDIMGHQIDYTYSTSGNVLYPESIRYGAAVNGSHPFEILFHSSPREDYRTDYSNGFFTAYNQIVTQVQILVQGTERLRYDLQYLPGHLKSRTDLKRLTLTGSNQQGSLSQDITFHYYSIDDGHTAALFHRNQFLKSVTFPKGGTISYDYKPSTQFFSELGGLANTRPHYPLFVVNTVHRTDPTGRDDVSSYHYADGYFFFESVNERELAGFGRVTVTDPLNNKVIHYFHQGGGFDGSALGESQDNWALIGQQYRSEQYDPQGKLIQRSISKWSSTELQAKRFFIYQENSVSSIFNQSGQSRSTANRFVYDLNTGNLIQAYELGEVSANDDGNYSDIGEDSRKSVTSYASNTTKHLLAFPATQQLFDHFGTLVSESRTLYDNLPLNQVHYGNITQSEQQFFEENRSISNNSSYNSEGLLTSNTDPLGNTTSILYDSLSLFPSTLTNSLGHQTTLSYDLAFSQATSFSNPNGLETEVILDPLGRVIEQKLSDPNSNNQLITMSTTAFVESSFPHHIINKLHLDNSSDTTDYYQYFDGFGRIIQTRAEDAGSPDQYIVSNMEYDALGRVVRTSLPVFASGSAYRLGDASPIVTSTTYDSLSRPLSMTDANGTTSFAYDLWDSTVTDALGHQKTTKADAYGRLVEVIENENGNSLSTKYTYDARDLLRSIENANGNIRNLSYDSLGRLVAQEDLHAPADTDFGVRSYTYDDNGNVLSVTKADGTVLSSTYDALNRVLTQVGPTVNYSYSYDQGQYGIGQLSSVVGNDHTWTGSYDIRGRLVSESMTLSNQPLAISPFTKSYSYTRFDQPEQVTFPDATTLSYSYNSVGQIDDINSSAGGIITHIGYSPLSQVEGVSYGNGLRSVFSYDPHQMYRMTKKRTEPAAIPVTFTDMPALQVSWSDWIEDRLLASLPSAHALETILDTGISTDPNAPAETTDTIFNDIGDGSQPSSFQQGVRSTRRSSTPMENPLRDQTGGEIGKPLPTHSGALGRGNDGLIYFRTQYVNTFQTPAQAVKYLIQVSQNNVPVWESPWTSIAVPVTAGSEGPYIAYDASALDPANGEVHWRMQYELADGTRTPMSDYTSVAVFQLEGGTGPAPTAPAVSFLQDIDYVYDAVGNIVSLIENSGTAATKTASYVYDDLYRLTETTVTGVISGEAYTRTQSYGPTGNILSKSDVGSYEYAQPGKTNPQAVTRIVHADGSSMDFQYDDNGNLTREVNTHADGSSVTKVLSWDELDRITSIEVTNEAGVVSTVSFVYDQGGRRLSKTISNIAGSKTTLYPFPDYEVTDEGKTKVSVSANNMHLATIETPSAISNEPSAIFFSHTDHLGGGNILTDANGDQAQTLDYYPFGSIRVDEQYADFDETKKYTGHEFDDSTGYYYAQARYYHPDIGRFISEDPLGWRPGDIQKNFLKHTQFFNAYSYAVNNPIRLIDPTGEVPIESAIDIIAVTLSAIAYNQDPSLGNATWLFLDSAGLAVPYLPSVFGYVRYSAKTVKIAEYFTKVAGRLDNYGVTDVAYQFAKNYAFNFSKRAWSPGKAGDSIASITGHFLLHGNEVGASTIDEYYQMANNFIDNGGQYIISEGTDTVYYSMKTNELAITNSEGAIKSYYKIDLQAEGQRLQENIQKFKKTVQKVTDSVRKITK